MNVIVSNKQKEIIDNVNIDAIKDLNGLFSIDDLLSKFKNYFFSKMILDATSIINFSSKEVLEKLATEIGGERLIILLPPSPEPPPEFVNKLIDLKIYNFSTNIDDVVRFLTNPNTAETFANRGGFGNDEQMYVDNSIKANNEFDNGANFDNQNMNHGFDSGNYSNDSFNGIVTPSSQYGMPQDSFSNNQSMGFNNQNGYMNPSPMGGNAMPMGMPQMNNNSNIPVGIPQTSNNQNIPMGIPQTSNNQNIPMGIPQGNNNQSMPMGMPQNNFSPSPMPGNPMMMGGGNPMNGMPQPNNNMGGFNYNQQAQASPQNMPNIYQNQAGGAAGNIRATGLYNGDKKVYGIKNVTPHAGSTTLTYLLTKEVSENLGKKVLAIEVDRHDFIYFPKRDDMISVDTPSLLSTISSRDAEIIFIDLNNYRDFSVCDEVIYLVEPSTIKLNLLMAKSRFAFKALVNKKVVLNKSMLSNSDAKILASEAGVEFLMNIPPLNERTKNNIIVDLFKKL